MNFPNGNRVLQGWDLFCFFLGKNVWHVNKKEKKLLLKVKKHVARKHPDLLFIQANSVIIIIIFWNKYVVLLQKSSEVLADQSSNVQEGHHHHSHSDQTKRCLEYIRSITAKIEIKVFLNPSTTQWTFKANAQ